MNQLFKRFYLLLFVMSAISCDFNNLEEIEEAKVLSSFSIDNDTHSNYGSTLFFEEGDFITSSSLLKDTNNFILKVYSTEGVKV